MKKRIVTKTIAAVLTVHRKLFFETTCIGNYSMIY